ncbi:MAG: nuclear transport factor 2 family protein [Actinomycetota bacterium]
MSDDANRSALERAWKAIQDGDLDPYEEILAEDCVQEWPQSGEVIRGKANITAVNRNYPGFPSMKVRELRGGGDLWVGEAELDYHGRRVLFCSIWEMRDGTIVRETDYFSDPFDAPQWRARWVERPETRPPPPATRW